MHGTMKIKYTICCDIQNMLNPEIERNMRRLMENICALLLIFFYSCSLNYIYCAVADREELTASNAKRTSYVTAINKILKTWKAVKKKI